MFYPMKCVPIYKERVWGGRNFDSTFGKELPEGVPVGESWELCVQPQESNLIANGAFAGESLKDIIDRYPKEMLGENVGQWMETFPLLIKFIDANDRLSVQVHPGDDYAKKYEDSLGKTELWYILEAKEGAKIIYGLKEDVDQQTFKKALEDGKIEETLNEIEVKAGDLFYIPAGTVHAIGEGIMIAEIQQNSDITYRVYDWKRLGLDGKPRALHVDKALDVINFDPKDRETQDFQTCIMSNSQYFCCPYFTVKVQKLNGNDQELIQQNNFEIMMCIEGNCSVDYGEGKETLYHGETIFLPAAIEKYTLSGKATILKIYMQTMNY